jgi:hypothetical protein
VAISGILEPCYDVGGDAFDYAIDGQTMHVALFDAVGHGIGASTLTTIAVNAYRNAAAAVWACSTPAAPSTPGYTRSSPTCSSPP